MAKLTERENMLRMLRGEMPEWVPISRMGPGANGEVPHTQMVLNELLQGHQISPGNAVDIWGVTHITNSESAGGKMPDPNHPILDDIRKWRDVIKAPNLDDYDFEAMAKRDLEKFHINREQSCVELNTFVGLFLTLVSFMGFYNAFLAMCEEPEEVKALNEYLTDFYVDAVERMIDYYQPDIFSMCEDNASATSPFMSLDTYRDLFKPYTERLAKPALDRGIFVSMHDCGHCEQYIDDWMDYGVVSWNPAQTSNDLDAIKKKYGRKLIICGGWDGGGRLLRDDVTEDEVKQAVYDTVNRLAPDGGYVFAGGFLGPMGDEVTKRKNRWVAEAANEICPNFYK